MSVEKLRGEVSDARGSESITPVPPESARPAGAPQRHHVRSTEQTVWEKCGGQTSMDDMAGLSSEIEAAVRQNLQSGESPWLQPPVMQGIGLENMIAHAITYKDRFDRLCEALASNLCEQGFHATYKAASVKSVQSAQGKVTTIYHGDCCQLTDIVRGTMVLHIEPSPENLKEVYSALELMVHSRTDLDKANAKFTHFADRYRRPLGNYSDWLFLMKVADFVAELQVNLEEAVKVKEGVLHKDYEMERLGKRKLLQATMAGESDMAMLLLKANVSVHSADQHRLTPLHYAARHGLDSLIVALLAAGAKPYSPDGQGHSPLYHAVVMGHKRATEVLLDAMEEDTSSLPDEGKPALISLHRVWYLASELLGDVGVAGRIGDLVAKAFHNKLKQYYFVVGSGDARVLEQLMQSSEPVDLNLALCTRSFFPEKGVEGNVMDWAIMSGSVAMVDLLFHQAPISSMQVNSKGPHQDGAVLSACLKSDDGSHFKAFLRYCDKRGIELSEFDLPHILLDALLAGNFKLANAMASANITLEFLENTEKDTLVTLVGDAAAAGEVGLIKLIADAHAPIMDYDPKNGYTPLHRAVFSGQAKVITELLHGKADINISEDTFEGSCFTPLVCAVDTGQAKMVKFLVQLRADLEKAPEYSCSAMECATRNHDEPMMKLLSSLGAAHVPTKEKPQVDDLRAQAARALMLGAVSGELDAAFHGVGGGGAF